MITFDEFKQHKVLWLVVKVINSPQLYIFSSRGFVGTILATIFFKFKILLFYQKDFHEHIHLTIYS